MISHTPPGGEPRVYDHPRLVVGRSKPAQGDPEPRVRLQGVHVSKTHGMFVALGGVVRYVDLNSRYGTLLLPARGPPRKLEPMRLEPLWPGDGVALGGGEIPADAGAAHAARRMHVFQVLSQPPAGAESPEQAEKSAPLSATACTVCHDPLLCARVLPCGHTFCADCITRWFRERSSCPSCRASCDQSVVATGGAACVQLDEMTRVLVRAHGDEGARHRFEQHDAVTELVRSRKRKAP